MKDKIINLIISLKYTCVVSLIFDLPRILREVYFDNITISGFYTINLFGRLAWDLLPKSTTASSIFFIYVLYFFIKNEIIKTFKLTFILSMPIFVLGSMLCVFAHFLKTSFIKLDGMTPISTQETIVNCLWIVWLIILFAKSLARKKSA